MKMTQCCYTCLTKLVYQAADLATSNHELKNEAINAGLYILQKEFSRNEVSIVIATHIHDVIKKITGNSDPYSNMKKIESLTARELYTDIRSNFDSSFDGLLKLAVIGNTIDFFRSLDDVRHEMKINVNFAVDDSALFHQKLQNSRRILYLADNTGEIFFDLPLLKWMRQFGHVQYVVKSAPVQNDVTLDDIKNAGLMNAFGDVITTGTATPGIIFSLASDEFKHEFDHADVILAKGMGYFESLSEMSPMGRIFYCLKAKCQPVADSLCVPYNSYIAMLR